MTGDSQLTRFDRLLRLYMGETVSDEQPRLDEATRQAIATRLADHQCIPVEEALARVDDVWQHGVGSEFAAQCLPIVGAMLRPIINEIKVAMESPDPYSPEAAVAVMATVAAVLPEVGGDHDQ